MVRERRSKEERKYIAANLKKFRKAKYNTTTMFADAIGMNYQQVSGWERGKYAPDSNNLKKLAKHLDVTVEQITSKPDDWRESGEVTEGDSKDVAPKKGVNSVDKDDGTKDFVSIVQVLTNFQSKFNNGELNLSQEEYLQKIRRVNEFIAFEYRDLMP